MDLSMDTVHLEAGSEGSALTLPLLSLRIVMLCHCSLAMTKAHLL